MLRISGASSKNKIFFSTNRCRVTATYQKDGVIKIKTKELKYSTIKNFISKIPLIRGLFFSVPENWYCILISILFLAVEIFNLNSRKIITC